MLGSVNVRVHTLIMGFHCAKNVTISWHFVTHVRVKLFVVLVFQGVLYLKLIPLVANATLLTLLIM